MKKLLRILFVICTVAFITTVTTYKSCNSVKGGAPIILKFTAAAKGVTIDESKDVYKITINPSLLTYDNNTQVAPIFEVAFANKQKGLIVPSTTADKAEDLEIESNLPNTEDAIEKYDDAVDILELPIGKTFSFLKDIKPGFMMRNNNSCWDKAAEGAIPNIVNPSSHHDDPAYVFVMCQTEMTGINGRSFAKTKPAANDDLAIGNDTKTKCTFRLVTEKAADTDAKATARKAWAAKVVELETSIPNIDRNLLQVNFVGFVTGDDKAYEISKVAPSLLDDTGLTTEDSAKLVEKYDSGFLKVEIVIAPAK